MFELRATRVVEDEILVRNIHDHDKPERQIRRVQHWNGGSIWLAERPDLSDYDEAQGLSVFETFEVEDHLFEDGQHEFVFPDSMPEGTRQRVLEVDEEGDLIDDGWEVLESETRFFGPLVIIGG